MTPADVCDASLDDIPAIREIFNRSITETLSVWLERPRSVDEMRDWFEQKTLGNWPVRVIHVDGRVAGYATYGPFRTYDGYRHTVEHSVHVHPEHRRKGIARTLLSDLMAKAPTNNIHVMIAGIESTNAPSISLHQSLGFQEVARMPEVGRKFDRWLTLVFMQKTFDPR